MDEAVGLTMVAGADSDGIEDQSMAPSQPRQYFRSVSLGVFAVAAMTAAVVQFGGSSPGKPPKLRVDGVIMEASTGACSYGKMGEVPEDFGYLTGGWAPCKKDSDRLAKCAFTMAAEDDDGKFLAGVKDGPHFKMAKFNADGSKVKDSGKYFSGGAPTDAAEMVKKYKTAKGTGDNYRFTKGDGFVCPQENEDKEEENEDASDEPAVAATPYADLGAGKCILEGGGDPKAKWVCGNGWPGDIKKKCDADSECMGFSEAHTGCGLLWKSGPLKGGGSPWGGCKCFRKRKKNAKGQPLVDPDEGEPETKYLSSYYIKKGQCPENEIIRDFSECVNKVTEIAPDRMCDHGECNKKINRDSNAGCMVTAYGVEFNENEDITNGWDYKDFLCKKAKENMPDFEAMKKDQEKLIWYCLKKAGDYKNFKQCMNEITDNEHAG